MPARITAIVARTTMPPQGLWLFVRRCVLPLIALSFAAPAAAETVRVGGIGAALETMRLLGEAFRKNHPGADIVVVPRLGSSGGIKAVLDGTIDLSVSGRPLKDQERAQGAFAVEYGRSPFVFAVASRSKISAITLRELLAIYKGETASWPDGSPLRLVLRLKTESDIEILKGVSPEMSAAVDAALAREGMIVAMTDQDNAVRLEKIPGAIGTSNLVQIVTEKRPLKPLKLDGVAPSADTLANGAYRHYNPFLFVTGPKASPLARKFVEFAGSPAGRAILAQNGYWVAPRQKPRAEHPE